MVQIELNNLPNYEPKSSGMIKSHAGDIVSIMGYPIPELELVDEHKHITIMDEYYQEVVSKLSTQISHFAYGPDQLLNNLLVGNDNPRLFFKNRMKNNWLERSQYGHPITVFTHHSNNINLSVKNQLVYKREHLIDVTHPYFPTLKLIYADYNDHPWPWATLEMSISEIRIGDQILNQIQLFEIDLNLRYYLEVADPSPFTAFQITA